MNISATFFGEAMWISERIWAQHVGKFFSPSEGMKTKHAVQIRIQKKAKKRPLSMRAGIECPGFAVKQDG